MSLLLPNASMDDKLDALYFCLPVMWGEGRQVADKLGVCQWTMILWLRRLEAEGLVERVSPGCWLERFD